MDRDARRTLAVVFGIVFVDLLGFGILLPVIPLYARSFGASAFVGSLLIAAFSAMQFLAAPVLGRLSDARGRRPVLLLSLFGSTLAWTMFGLAESIVVLFVARLLAGAMGGNIAAAQAVVADVTSPDERAKGLGLIGAAFGLGFVFGPALGALSSTPAAVSAVNTTLATVGIEYAVGQYALPSFVAAAICGVNLLLALVFLPETRPADSGDENPETRKQPQQGRLDRIREALATPLLGTLVVSFFVVSFAFSALESQFVFFTDDVFGYDTTMNGYLLAYFGVVIAVVQGGLVGPLTERFGEIRLAVAGSAIQAVTLVAVPFTPTLATTLPAVAAPGPLTTEIVALWLVATPLSFGNAITNVSLTTLVSQSSSADDQGGAFGLTQSAGSLARTFGPGLAGLLYTAVAPWVPFVVAGFLFVPVAVTLARVTATEAAPVSA
ncbi:MFS transporter [Haloarchaeobius sp. DFWS5]|uniref:MFS transporter n=1 Tax=Haloarchaeobius sp. DFWS5 TaxID=3446114 RepID=UPI003EB7CE4B